MMMMVTRDAAVRVWQDWLGDARSESWFHTQHWHLTMVGSCFWIVLATVMQYYWLADS